MLATDTPTSSLPRRPRSKRRSHSTSRSFEPVRSQCAHHSYLYQRILNVNAGRTKAHQRARHGRKGSVPPTSREVHADAVEQGEVVVVDDLTGAGIRAEGGTSPMRVDAGGVEDGEDIKGARQAQPNALVARPAALQCPCHAQRERYRDGSGSDQLRDAGAGTSTSRVFWAAAVKKVLSARPSLCLSCEAARRCLGQGPPRTSTPSTSLA
jgi:hypothetical protein